MSGAAKFATEEMKAQAVTYAEQIAGGESGPQGRYQEMIDAGSIPEELPCEAYGIWDAYGQLIAAASADGMNGWYFHLDCTDDSVMPFVSQQTYEGQDSDGNAITVSEGQAMIDFVSGTNKYFFINGERFTLAGPREGPEDVLCFPVTCTGTSGRGAIATFDTDGTGVSIHVFSTSPAVRTEERLGADKTGPDFPNAAVDARGALADKVAKHTAAGCNPFWVTNYGS